MKLGTPGSPISSLLWGPHLEHTPTFRTATQLSSIHPPLQTKPRTHPESGIPPQRFDDPKSGKCQRKHKVIISDEDDPEGMPQSDCYLCLSMIILYNNYHCYM